MYKTSESQHVIIILLKPFGQEQKPTLQPPFLEIVIQRVLYSEYYFYSTDVFIEG